MSKGGGDFQRLSDLAVLLPVSAAALFMPPILHLFAKPYLPGGVPLIFLYIFGVWGALIVAGFLIARRLGEAGEPPDEGVPDLGQGDARG